MTDSKSWPDGTWRASYDDLVERRSQPPGRGASEQRRQRRVACQGFAEVILNGRSFLFRGTIRDLSVSGCYVESKARLLLDHGARVELRFTVAGDTLVVPAEIVAIRAKHGAGFQFLEMEEEKQERLRELISRLGPPTARKVRPIL